LVAVGVAVDPLATSEDEPAGLEEGAGVEVAPAAVSAGAVFFSASIAFFRDSDG
jgi:hypothetical protein